MMNSIKVVVTGTAASGKTCMLQQYIALDFLQMHTPTTISNFWADVFVNDVGLKICMWDTGDSEVRADNLETLYLTRAAVTGTANIIRLQACNRLRPHVYIAADVIVICFSIVNPVSFQEVREKVSIDYVQLQVSYFLVKVKRI
jgi:GTPase SAR1 family protein